MEINRENYIFNQDICCCAFLRWGGKNFSLYYNQRTPNRNMFLVYMLFVRDFKALLRVCPVETGVILEVVTLVTMTEIKYKAR